MSKKSRLPKLGYLVKAFPRISETFILNEILRLEAEGVPLHIYSMTSPPKGKRHSHADEVASPVTYMPYPLLPSAGRLITAHLQTFFRNPLRYTYALIKAVAAFDKDLVERFIQAGYLSCLLRKDAITHLHAGFVHAPGSVAWIAHLMTGIPFSLATHAKDLYHSPEKLLRKKFNQASRVFTCTQYNVAHLQKTFSDTISPKLQHAYHGVDLSRFPFGAHSGSPVPLVLSVARLVEKKGLRNLVRACGILRDSGRIFHCSIIGEGELRGSLEKLIRDHSLEEVVTLEGAMDQDEVKKWYRSATVFALPSVITSDGDRDGIPNVIVEAAAMGIPVVSTGVSGIGELIKHGETGLQVAPGSPEELAAAIESLLESSELRDKLRTRARAAVEERFCLKKNAFAIAESMKSLMGVP